MKTISWTKLLFIHSALAALVMVTFNPNAEATANPSSTLVKVFEMRVSPNTDCSASISVFKTASPTVSDLISNPTFGIGAIPNGTYKCLMIHLSDVITFTPAVSDGANCVGGTQYTRDIFRAGSTSTAPDGTTITGTGAVSTPSEDDPWAYFKIGGSNGAGCMSPTTGCALGSPLVVSGDHVGTLVIDFDGKIDGTFSPCDLGPAAMSFR
jgi:hypothetical protein